MRCRAVEGGCNARKPPASTLPARVASRACLLLLASVGRMLECVSDVTHILSAIEAGHLHAEQLLPLSMTNRGNWLPTRWP
jgi:hypothetical protein